MKTSVTTADGVRIALHSEGEGAPVLLLHGFASSIEQNWRSTGWLRILTEAGLRVAALDFRGHGGSDKPHDIAAYGEKMTLDILAAMEALDAQSAAVVGYSMGGMMGLHLLLRHPERVNRLAIGGVGANYFDAPLHYQAIAAALADDDAPADPVAAAFRSFASQAGKDREALAACIAAGFPRHPRVALTAARRPVLVVCGDADDSAGAPEPLAEALPDGHACRLPGRDHMSAVGDAGFKKAVLEFLGVEPVLWR